jgi:hypothetical protein
MGPSATATLTTCPNALTLAASSCKSGPSPPNRCATPVMSNQTVSQGRPPSLIRAARGGSAPGMNDSMSAGGSSATVMPYPMTTSATRPRALITSPGVSVQTRNSATSARASATVCPAVTPKRRARASTAARRVFPLTLSALMGALSAGGALPGGASPCAPRVSARGSPNTTAKPETEPETARDTAERTGLSLGVSSEGAAELFTRRRRASSHRSSGKTSATIRRPGAAAAAAPGDWAA